MSSEHHVRRSGGGISWFALIVGIGLGIAGGLLYTWEIDPVVERNTAPWQLSQSAKNDYVVAIALSYASNSDLEEAFNRLRAVTPDQNVWDAVAQVACERVKTGKTVTNSDIRVIRALEQLYKPQGASGCADGLYPTPAPVVFVTPVPTITLTPTLTPPPTKTATPPPEGVSPEQTARPTSTPAAGDTFVLGRMQSFCDPTVPGVIEVRVYDWRGLGIPGIPVSVTWSGSETDHFFTGLKPERGDEYADFEMVNGRTYTVTVPGLVSTAPSVEATACTTTVDGVTVNTIMSYYVNFQQRAN